MKSQLFKIRGNLDKKKSITIGVCTWILILLIWSLLAYWHVIFPTGEEVERKTVEQDPTAKNGEYIIYTEKGTKPLIPETILPPPHKVLIAFKTLYWEKELLISVYVSFRRIFLGFLFAGIVALPVGVLIGSFPFFRAALTPFTRPMRYMPIAAFVPLFMIWFGIGEVSKVMLLFLGTVVFMIPIVVEAIDNVKTELLQTAYTLGASKLKVVMTVLVPAALPSIFEGLRVMNAIGWTYVILAEMVNARQGLGHMIIISQRYSKTDEIFAGIVIIGFIGILSDIFIRKINNTLFAWKEGL